MPFATATPLFADGLIDSIRILEIIAWVEQAIGRQIPDAQIRMDNFFSVERIAEVFLGEDHHGTADDSHGAADDHHVVV